ncbi:MAG: hypothetical protein WA324_00605 [Bryobacteraceae bacterium]
MSISGPQPCLVVGTPCYGRMVTDQYAGSLLKLQMACVQRGVRLLVQMMGSDALITRARQNIVADFLTNEAATHLIFIDADIGFEPEQVFRLLDFNRDVTAAVYPIKRIDWEKIDAVVQAGRKPLESAALSYMIEFANSERIEVINGFARVTYAGTGFFMIQRHVLLAMMERYPELRYGHDHKPNDKLSGNKWRSALFNCMIDEATGTYLSEDFSFCKRWTDMGGEIWADLESRLTHVGTVSFRGDLATQFNQGA